MHFTATLTERAIAAAGDRVANVQAHLEDGMLSLSWLQAAVRYKLHGVMAEPMATMDAMLMAFAESVEYEEALVQRSRL